MEFGWINLFGAGIVVLMMIPNIIYAARQKQDETQIEVPRGLSACEQVGRYGCIILMWLPLLVWKFGFGSVEEFLIYLVGNGALLLCYYLFWMLYSKKKDLIKGNGVSCHSNRDIFSFRHTASPLAFGGICNSVRNCSLYDHIHDA